MVPRRVGGGKWEPPRCKRRVDRRRIAAVSRAAVPGSSPRGGGVGNAAASPAASAIGSGTIGPTAAVTASGATEAPVTATMAGGDPSVRTERLTIGDRLPRLQAPAIPRGARP